jgi:hypothetical protein
MRHRWKWISALLIAAALGCAFWLRQRPASPVPVAAASAPPLAASASRWPDGIPTAISRTPKTVDPAADIEVCGVGKVKLDRNDEAAAGKYLDALTKNSRLRWLAALRNSDDYRARAAGLYLEGIFDRDSPQKDPEAARDELVQLAVGTQDPAAFALANTKCMKSVEDPGSPGACPQLSLDDWARADADNAVPWLVLAAKARREGDSAAEAAAFARAAAAHHYETYNWSMLAFAQPAMPGDLTATEHWILTSEIIGVQAAMPMPYFPLFQYCSPDALRNATVQQQCDAIAELMVSKATTLLDLSMGDSLGKRVGWSAERMNKLTQELHASMQAFTQAIPLDAQQQWSCDSVARGNAFMSQWSELGDRGLANQAIERSGESITELSRKYDERTAKMMREIQESAAAREPAPQP